MNVHQLFGFIGDGDMPDMFKDNQNKVIEFCNVNNYKYKLWTPQDADDLFIGYEKYRPLYDNVRYSIMKVDIIRFIILHKYGGLYLDLDVEPKLKSLKPYDLACSVKIIEHGRKVWEIEILQSCKDNPVLLQYLDYVITQVDEKNKITIYNDWKLRYVCQTTGPYSFTRFIKKNKIKIIEYKSNHPRIDKSKKDAGDMGKVDGDEDFISYPSISWFSSVKETSLSK